MNICRNCLDVRDGSIPQVEHKKNLWIFWLYTIWSEKPRILAAKKQRKLIKMMKEATPLTINDDGFPFFRFRLSPSTN